jgi:hypothetical protein
VVLGSASSRATASPEIVYLVPRSPAEPSRLPAPFPVMTSAGIRLVHSDAELKSAFSADTAAIVVDAAAASLVDRTWLTERHREGVLIVGVNIDMFSLWGLIAYERPLMPDGTRAPAGPWRTSDEWDGRNFYTYHHFVYHAYGRAQGGGQCHLEDFGSFLAIIKERATLAERMTAEQLTPAEQR